MNGSGEDYLSDSIVLVLGDSEMAQIIQIIGGDYFVT